MMFTRFARSAGRSAMALALLAGGAAATVVAVPAAAKEKEAKPAKADYSKDFMAAYNPVQTMVQDAFDAAAARAAVDGVMAAATTADDKYAAGNLVLNIGQKAQDQALQLRGLQAMIDSGKTPAEKLGLFQFSLGQLAYVTNDYARARTALQAAMASGYVENDVEGLIAETYFGEKNFAEGLRYLAGVIDAKTAAGQPVKEDWIKRGLALSYNNNLIGDANQFARRYVAAYPSATTWGDAVAILLNTSKYDNPEVLDLLRLARRTASFRDGRMFADYLDAADYRRLPAEVITVIDEGVAKGLVKSSDPLIADTLAQAKARAASDAKDLPAILRDGRAAGASLTSVLAAGDVLLSMGKAGEAEEFYAKALGAAGVNTPLVLTRLGISQFDQGKYADAATTFAKVEGARQAIASLWGIYAKQKAAPAAQ